jgi:hypothetical protein
MRSAKPSRTKEYQVVGSEIPNIAANEKGCSLGTKEEPPEPESLDNPDERNDGPYRSAESQELEPENLEELARGSYQ